MASTVDTIIDQSFVDLGVTRPGETVSATIKAAAFLIFQQMVANLSQEPLMVRIGLSTFQPIAGQNTYSCGPSGQFDTGLANPLMIGPTWRSRTGTLTGFQIGGKVISFEEFEAVVADGLHTSAQLAKYVAANQPNGLQSPNSTPLASVRLWPTPAASPGLLDIDLMFPLTTFAAVTDQLNGFSPGWEAMFHYNLAVALAPQYARGTGITPELAAMASNSKATIAALAASILGINRQPQAPPQAA